MNVSFRLYPACQPKPQPQIYQSQPKPQPSFGAKTSELTKALAEAVPEELRVPFERIKKYYKKVDIELNNGQNVIIIDRKSNNRYISVSWANNVEGNKDAFRVLATKDLYNGKSEMEEIIFSLSEQPNSKEIDRLKAFKEGINEYYDDNKKLIRFATALEFCKNIKCQNPDFYSNISLLY